MTRLGPLARDILDSLILLGWTTRRELADHVGRSYLDIKQAVARLVRNGMIAHTRSASLGIGKGTAPQLVAITPKGRRALALRVAIGLVPGVPYSARNDGHLPRVSP